MPWAVLRAALGYGIEKEMWEAGKLLLCILVYILIALRSLGGFVAENLLKATSRDCGSAVDGSKLITRDSVNFYIYRRSDGSIKILLHLLIECLIRWHAAVV